ncbi:hypothetical protein EDB84DRAFT_1444978 [Lactarius hengduanensis]|nr:hypothetical protein EDB84DRAFT_1444978 [Lactarius hengduanensis]
MRTDKGERGANSGSEDTKREQEQKRVTRSDVLRVHVVGPDFQDERCTEPSPYRSEREGRARSVHNGKNPVRMRTDEGGSGSKQRWRELEAGTRAKTSDKRRWRRDEAMT